MTEEELRDWLTLRAIDGVGAVTLRALVETFGSPRAVRGASADALCAGGCSDALVQAIVAGPNDDVRRTLDREVREIARRKITILSYLDDRYPALLKAIPDPPVLLYIMGEWRPDETCTVAIVGSRKSTPQGRAMTERLSEDLARAGWTVVSGLARGVDAAAHRGAIAGGGRTLAVLGCGIDRMYPPEHATLRRQIENNGAVLSEFALGAPPHSYHFPQRNRIISGLSRGVIVTEATVESGSLITARLAGEQGREVFAVPGSVREATSRGPHRLIKDGATLVESADDAIQHLLPQLDEATRERLRAHGGAQDASPAPTPVTFTQDERRVLAALSLEPIEIDLVPERCGLPSAMVSATLLSLELKGAIRQLPGQRFLRLIEL
ncbi:MAG: DNA-processing protein DprA [Nitrospiraceae bacterium]